jgi:hypothetical protein
MSMSDVLTRLRRELLAFAAGYPDRWVDETDPCALPLRRLVEAFAEEILGTADVWSAARQLGAKLRKHFGYVTPGHVDEASADHLRGLMYVAAEALHGSVSTDFGGGDKLTAEQVAFYAADDWWHGRDDRPVAEWPDIRRVREQLTLDALDVPSADRGDVLGFAAGFIRRHPDLIRDTEWGLFAVGSGEGFEEEVWAATGRDYIWLGVYFFAEVILAQLSAEQAVH